MARPPRINLEGGFYHVIHRGNYRQAIFTTDRDREAFLERVGRCARLFDCRIHAYCLMGNHVHLLVETLKPNLSAFGQRLFGSYTLWFNRKHDRVGHLLQGRFKAMLLEAESYLAELSRYIHLNPVRARMVEKSERYRWSSLGAYARPGAGEPWVHTRSILDRLEGSRKAYLDYVYEGIGEAWKPTVADRLFLGSEGFVKKVRAILGRKDPGEGRRQEAEEDRAARLVRAVLRAHGVSAAEVRRKYVKDPRVAGAKRAAMHLLRRETTLTHRRIGMILGGVAAPVVAQGVRRVEASAPERRRAESLARSLLDT